MDVYLGEDFIFSSIGNSLFDSAPENVWVLILSVIQVRSELSKLDFVAIHLALQDIQLLLLSLIEVVYVSERILDVIESTVTKIRFRFDISHKTLQLIHFFVLRERVTSAFKICSDLIELRLVNAFFKDENIAFNNFQRKGEILK